MPSVHPETSDQDREPFVEIDPSGRFGRYSDLLGTGAVKKVYRGFDQVEGRDIAWNQVKLRNFSDDPSVLKRLLSEVELLQSLNNENIIVLYSSWRDVEHSTLNFITEACASGNLRDYRKKHRRVSLKAMKNWSRQILRGLEYLHTHDPCIIHRDLNCSNIFINGNIGQVFIHPSNFMFIHVTIIFFSHDLVLILILTLNKRMEFDARYTTCGVY